MADTDIAVVGAGPAGMALALALLQAGRMPMLLDARNRAASREDPRVLALSHGSRQILERLGVWTQLAPTPIESIHVSQRGGFGRTLLHARDYGLPALGYVLEANVLANVLDKVLARHNVVWRDGTTVQRVGVGSKSVDVLVSTPVGDDVVSARLVAYAEGAVAGGAKSVERDYRQRAVLAIVKTLEPGESVAYERFTPNGPLALLPFGAGYAVVLTADEATALEIGELGEPAFLARLQQEVGERLHFVSATPRTTFPLTLRFRRSPVAARQVWVGNSAQTLHPVAGQGFNLALRDVWELATLLGAPDGKDAGAPDLLRRYAARRRLDRSSAIGFTDGLVRLFGSENLLLRAARGTGLLALDLAPPLRDFVARRMIFGARAWP